MASGGLTGLEAKVVRLEASIESLLQVNQELKKENAELYDQTQRLITEQALLAQSVKELVQRSRDRKSVTERVLMFVVGGFIAAAISWIVRGGLSS